MSSEEARQIVEDGLERRKAEREQRDAELENQERILRLKINDNHHYRTMSEYQLMELQMNAERKRYELQKKRHDEMVAISKKAEEIINKYGIFCLVMVVLAIISRLNIFVLLATVLGAAVFPVIRIGRLYGLV